MYIKDISLVNFRNYEKLKLNFNKGINIIYGNNGQGKTNLLESLYVLAFTKSHRSYLDENLIMNNKTSLKIVGNIYESNIKSKLEIQLDDKNKIIKVDNNEIKKINEYISKMNIIIFYPDDLELIKGSPNLKRKFINLELSQLYSDYFILNNDYNKILKIRNDYLKNNKKFDENYFNIITNYLIDKAVQIYRIRNKFINKINDIVSDIYKDLTKLDNFKLIYKTSINFENFDKEYLKNKLLNSFNNIKEKEIKYKITLIGPHRDDIEFFLGDENLKLSGSQGQQRMAVLAIKLAELEIFYRYKNNYPILLLDDVLSELDKSKKNNLLKYIKDDVQVLITTTDLATISKKLLKKAKLIEIEKGEIKNIKEVI